MARGGGFYPCDFVLYQGCKDCYTIPFQPNLLEEITTPYYSGSGTDKLTIKNRLYFNISKYYKVKPFTITNIKDYTIIVVIYLMDNFDIIYLGVYTIEPNKSINTDTLIVKLPFTTININTMLKCSYFKYGNINSGSNYVIEPNKITIGNKSPIHTFTDFHHFKGNIDSITVYREKGLVVNSVMTGTCTYTPKHECATIIPKIYFTTSEYDDMVYLRAFKGTNNIELTFSQPIEDFVEVHTKTTYTTPHIDVKPIIEYKGYSLVYDTYIDAVTEECIEDSDTLIEPNIKVSFTTSYYLS